jgi:hypothetical protein
MESPGLSIVVYGQQAMESPNSEKYQCTGSMEPAIVRESFNRLLPIWQSLNLSESNRLEDSRVSLGARWQLASFGAAHESRMAGGKSTDSTGV